MNEDLARLLAMASQLLMTSTRDSEVDTSLALELTIATLKTLGPGVVYCDHCSGPMPAMTTAAMSPDGRPQCVRCLTKGVYL